MTGQVWRRIAASIRSPPVDSRVRIRLRQCAANAGASLWYRATPSGISNRRFHLVSLECKIGRGRWTRTSYGCVQSAVPRLLWLVPSDCQLRSLHRASDVASRKRMRGLGWPPRAPPAMLRGERVLATAHGERYGDRTRLFGLKGRGSPRDRTVPSWLRELESNQPSHGHELMKLVRCRYGLSRSVWRTSVVRRPRDV